jgi:hypothetical protein
MACNSWFIYFILKENYVVFCLEFTPEIVVCDILSTDKYHTSALANFL